MLGSTLRLDAEKASLDMHSPISHGMSGIMIPIERNKGRTSPNDRDLERFIVMSNLSPFLLNTCPCPCQVPVQDLCSVATISSVLLMLLKLLLLQGSMVAMI